jgi:IclR family transcriptional regulator, acetate operon repressor
VKGESVSGLGPAPAAVASRSLSTARAVLRVLALLMEKPSGVRADEVAGVLGKSTSTAYYLLTSLCEEGFAVHETKGVYRPALGLEQLTAVAEQAGGLHEGVARTVDELFVRTRKRSYLGVVRKGRIEIVAFRGRQGVRRMPGLGSEIRDSAHALAMGKVVLALLEADSLARYIARGLKSFTPQTITAAEELSAELDRVRRDGFAVDREEFDEDFCCIAAPIFDGRRRFVAALGLSTTPHVFDSERHELTTTVVDVARGALAAGAAGPVSTASPPRELQAHAKKSSFLPPIASRLSLAVRPAGGSGRFAVTREPAKRSKA